VEFNEAHKIITREELIAYPVISPIISFARKDKIIEEET